MVNKIEITQLLHSSLVSFEWSNNVNCRVVSWVFICEVEIFSNFFQLSNVSGSVKNDSNNLDLFILLNLGLLVSLWLFDVFLFIKDLRSVGLLPSFVINLAVYVDASYRVEIVRRWDWFSFFDFWLDWLEVRLVSYFWLDLWLYFCLWDDWCVLSFGWRWLGDGWWLGGWL